MSVERFLKQQILELREQRASLTSKLDTLRDENVGLRAALEFGVMTLEHAIALGYLGDGSTRGMSIEAVQNMRTALGARKDCQ